MAWTKLTCACSSCTGGGIRDDYTSSDGCTRRDDPNSCDRCKCDGCTGVVRYLGSTLSFLSLLKQLVTLAVRRIKNPCADKHMMRCCAVVRVDEQFLGILIFSNRKACAEARMLEHLHLMRMRAAERGSQWHVSALLVTRHNSLCNKRSLPCVKCALKLQRALAAGLLSSETCLGCWMDPVSPLRLFPAHVFLWMGLIDFKVTTVVARNLLLRRLVIQVINRMIENYYCAWLVSVHNRIRWCFKVPP